MRELEERERKESKKLADEDALRKIRVAEETIEHLQKKLAATKQVPVHFLVSLSSILEGCDWGDNASFFILFPSKYYTGEAINNNIFNFQLLKCFYVIYTCIDLKLDHNSTRIG